MISMSRVTEVIGFFILGLLVVFIYIVGFNTAPSKSYQNSLVAASELIRLPTLSLSSSYLNTQTIRLKDSSNDFYLGVKIDNYTGFVYDK
jgi:uncharacterized membrane protein